jgi:hypothetical protein
MLDLKSLKAQQEEKDNGNYCQDRQVHDPRHKDSFCLFSFGKIDVFPENFFGLWGFFEFDLRSMLSKILYCLFLLCLLKILDNFFFFLLSIDDKN